jgi:hypothetical protein
MARKRKKSFLVSSAGNAYQMAKVINVDNILESHPLTVCDGANADSVRDQCTAFGAGLWMALAETKRKELINLHGVDVAEKQPDDTYMVNMDLLRKLVWHSLLQSEGLRNLVDQFIDLESQELQAYEDAQNAKEEPPVVPRKRAKPTPPVTRWGGGL